MRNKAMQAALVATLAIGSALIATSARANRSAESGPDRVSQASAPVRHSADAVAFGSSASYRFQQ